MALKKAKALSLKKTKKVTKKVKVKRNSSKLSNPDIAISSLEASLKEVEISDSNELVSSQSSTLSGSSKIDDLIITHRENGRKLSRSFLRRWRVRMPLEEVDSIVDLALCEAASRFCEKKGASFMTFFYYHLRGQMVRYVESAVKRGNLLVQFSHTTELDITDWAQQGTAISSMQVTESVCSEKKDISTPEQLYIRQESIDKCRDACKGLDALEQEVLRRSYAGGEALVDIASSLGYSRCHISRVKKKAMIRLKIALQEKGITPNKTRKLDNSVEVDKVRKVRRRARRGGSSLIANKKSPKTLPLKEASLN